MSFLQENIKGKSLRIFLLQGTMRLLSSLNYPDIGFFHWIIFANTLSLSYYRSLLCQQRHLIEVLSPQGMKGKHQ
jgi:hypothetical protein